MAFTKVVGPGIHTLSNIASHNINSSGIITATQFDGPFSDVVVGGATTLTVDGINISAGILTAKTLDLNGNGDISGNLVVGGNFTANGDFTTLNTTLREVELLRVDANNDSLTAGIITQRGSGDILNLFDTSTEVLTVKDGGNVGIATDNPISPLHVRGTTHALGNGGASLVWGDNSSLGTLTYSGSNARITASNDLQIHSTKLRVGGGTTENADGAFDDLIIGNHSGNRGISILSGASSQGALGFAKSGTLADGYVAYNHNSTATDSSMVIKSSGKIQFNPGSSEKFTITDTGQVHFKGSASSDNNKMQIRVNNTQNEFRGSSNSSTNKAFVFYSSNTDASEKLRIDSTGAIVKQQFTATNTYAANDTTQCGYQSQNLSNTTNTYAALRLTAGASSPATAQLSSIRTGTGQNDFTIQLETGNTAFEALRIDSSGRLMIKNTAASSFNASVNQFVLGNGVGNQGMTIYTGASHSGSLIFNDVADGTFQGGFVYKHGSGTDDNQLRIYANVGSRVQVGATYLQVDDGTNARLKLAPDSATLNMIVSTTTGNGSYCNLSYQAADHIFKYGGNERGRLSTDGDFTITGEIASAQDYPNFRPKLDFNFAAVKKLDPRITYVRTGPASFINEFGKMVLVGANTPRFDHDPITRESKGLLIEHSRINYAVYSTKINNDQGSYYSMINSAVLVSDAGEAPDGTTTATKMYPASSGAARGIEDRYTLPSTGEYTTSVYVKAAGHTGWIALYGVDGGTRAYFNPTTGAKGASGAYPSTPAAGKYDIKDAGNGWYRIHLTVNETDISGQEYFYIYFGDSDGSVSVTHSGTNGILMWGLQVEKGSYPTSYIPTSAAAVTRGADFTTLIDDDFSDAISQTEGTLVAEYDNVTSDGYVLSLDGSGGNKIGMVNSSSYQLMGQAGGSSQGTTDNGTLLSGTNRFVLAYKVNDTAISINGNTATVDTSYTLPTTTFMSIGHRQSQYDQLGSCIARLMYYNTRLPNSQLKNLSTR